MNGNPYFVKPGSDFSVGLGGLSQTLAHVIEQTKERQETADQKAMMAKAQQVFATKDPKQIADFMISNPNMANVMEKTYQFYDEDIKKSHMETGFKILAEHSRVEKEGNTAMIASNDLQPGMLSSNNAIDKAFEDHISLLQARGAPMEEIGKMVKFSKDYNQNPEEAIERLRMGLASLDPKAYKAWEDMNEEKGTTSSALKKKIDERKKLIDEGMPEDDPIIKAYDRAIFGEPPDEKTVAKSNLKKMMDERDSLVDQLTEQGDEDPLNNPDVQAFNRKILGEQGKEFSPSGMKKLIDEREELADEMKAQGKTDEEIAEDPYIRAYDNKIAGIDIDIEDMSDKEIDYWGSWVNLTGRMPSLGRGKQATKLRAMIAKSAAEQALGEAGVDGKARTPVDAALETIAKSADTKAIASSITKLDNQMSMMEGFIENMGAQATELEKLGEDLFNYDTRLFNVPRRFIMKKITGSPLQAKWEMYLTELENEIGKLATNSVQSIAELSATAQDRWDQIHDKNLSVKDTLSLIDSTIKAAKMRRTSVQNALGKARDRMRTRDYPGGDQNMNVPTVDTQEEYDALPSGSTYIDKQDGKTYRKK